MPFCMKCGAQHGDTDKFCGSCGHPIGGTQLAAPTQVPNALSINDYTGQERTFTFFGETLTVSAEMDVFNHYRKEFHKLAKHRVAQMRMNYDSVITDLDNFLMYFAEVYSVHRQPLLDAAMNVFAQKNIFDISPEQFADQHTADFCLCSEDMDTMIESFNLTIEANQDRKIRMYNMMPGMVFSGLGGFAAALAVNVAFNAIAEADIRNADVSSSQRRELFQRIDTDVLMERAFLDYWRVFLSLTYALQQRGYGVWFPNEQDNNRAYGLYQNLLSGRIPAQMMPSQMILLLQANPYADEYVQFLKTQFGHLPEAQAIIQYFDVE